MSMTDTPTAETPKAPPKTRRRRSRRKPARAAATPKPVGIFAGMTVKNCPAACNADACVICEAPVCAHPAKAGLQSSMHTAGNLQRFKDAKRFLGEQKLDLTGT